MNDEDLIEGAFTRAALLLPDDPDRISRLRRARADRRRQRRGTLGLVAALVVVAGGTGLTLGLNRHTADSTSSVAGSHSGRYGASGTVVAVPGHTVRFCDPYQAMSAVAYKNPPPPNDTCAGVDVVGVNLATLSDRAVQDGVISGKAELQGTYSAGVLHVEQQGPPGSPLTPNAAFDTPPCPTPPGGWAREPGAPNSGNPDVTAAETYRMAHPAQVQQFAILRPSAHQALVYVLTNGDATAVRTALARDYRPDQLCVARSAYTPQQLAAVSTAPGLQVGENVTSTDTALDPRTGQPVFEVAAVLETAAMRAAAARQPTGLVQVTAWLQPV